MDHDSDVDRNGVGKNEYNQETMEEIEEVYNIHAIEKYTTDPSASNPQGILSVEHLGYTMKELGYTPTEAEIFTMLDEFDPEKIGFIDFKTFVNILKKNTKPMDIDQLRLSFTIFDKDKNGHIATQEIRYLTRHFGERYTDDEIEDMLREVDADGDGRINFDDFVYFMTK